MSAAQKPLIDGKAARLYVLDYGLFQVHSTGRIIGICGFLIRTDTGRNILVDTGFPEKYAHDHVQATREDRLDTFGRVLRLDRSNLPAGQLATIGLRSADIDLLVMTHTHIDHVGGMAGFPHAPIVIAAAERALERPLYHEDEQPLVWPEANYVLIDRDTDVCTGVRLLMTPGHAPGQMSLLIDLSERGAVVVTGDAISRPTEFDEGFSSAWDIPQAIDSAYRLMKLATERDAFVIYGHSPQQWPRLKKAPDFYG